MITYLDTSALAKLLADEAETSTLRAHFDNRVAGGDADLVSAFLLETELRCIATRTGIPQTAVTDMLSRLAMMDMHLSVFCEAGLLTGTSLRSLDALHIAAAVQAGANEFIYVRCSPAGAAEAVDHERPARRAAPVPPVGRCAESHAPASLRSAPAPNRIPRAQTSAPVAAAWPLAPTAARSAAPQSQNPRAFLASRLTQTRAGLRLGAVQTGDRRCRSTILFELD